MLPCPQYFLHAYVMCDAYKGDLAHSCAHGQGPHSIKVCITKKDNPDVFSSLTESVGPKPKIFHEHAYDLDRIAQRSLDKSIMAFRIAMNKISEIIVTVEDNWIIYEALMHHRSLLHTQHHLHFLYLTYNMHRLTNLIILVMFSTEPRIPLFSNRKSDHIFTIWQYVVMVAIQQYEGKS